MPKNLLLLIAFVLNTCLCFSQSYTLKGRVTDTTEGSNLHHTVVTLTRSKDSVLQKFTRTDEQGNFELKNLPTGKYLLMISHPSYADYVDNITINKDTSVGELSMFTKAMVLQTVIVKGSAIRMKGDTLAYMADSFKVKEGATVEDLLKRLPGIQVNSKGEITAQGEKVEKVLVDGEEFFGDDPTLATQNLIAKAVKEVQVFDKKSDQATFTGVDDGDKTKTINLKLKDEYKKGYFGKINLAGGLPNRWQNSAMINAFKDKRKFSVYAKMANTTETGLGWGEDNSYGGSMGTQTEFTEDGGMYMYNTSDDFGGAGGSFNGEGLPSSWMGGASYSNKWKADKNSVVGALRYQKINTEGSSTTTTQNILPDSTQVLSRQDANNYSSRWRIKGNAKSELNIDSLQSFTITADGNVGGSETSSLTTSNSNTGDSVMLNENDQLTTNNNDNRAFNSNILYKKKFKKKGRTISLNLSEKFSESESEGYLISHLRKYEKGEYSATDTTDQKKITDNHSLTFDSKISYTEPVGKNALIEASYGYRINNSTQKRLSYDNVDGKYSELNDVFSNYYKFKTGTHKAGLAYRYNYKKLIFGFGGDLALSKWQQTDLFKDTTRDYNFTNFFPKANFSYKLGQYSRIRLNYYGSTQAPSINQLQPVVDNSDRLNIAIGNPNLKQEFRQQFELGYNFYQVLKEQGLWASIWFSPTNNGFSTYNQTDSLGVNRYQTVNVNGNYNLGAWIGYNFKWKKPDIRINISANPSLNRNNNFVNGFANRTNTQSYNFSLSIDKYKEKKYQFNLGTDFGYNISKSSISTSIVTEYWTIKPFASMSLDLPKDFEFNTDFNYNWRQKTTAFPINNNAFLWNASINKKIWKKQDIRLGVKVNDILNQNIGFNRDVNSNYITEKTYTTIRRYWLATLTWNFNKGPKKEEEW